MNEFSVRAREKMLLSRRTDAYAVIAAFDETSDIAVPELKGRLLAQGASTSVTALWRYSRRHTQSARKMAHAAEQDRLEILTQHEAWFEDQIDLDLERLVLIDET